MKLKPIFERIYTLEIGNKVKIDSREDFPFNKYDGEKGKIIDKYVDGTKIKYMIKFKDGKSQEYEGLDLIKEQKIRKSNKNSHNQYHAHLNFQDVSTYEWYMEDAVLILPGSYPKLIPNYEEEFDTNGMLNIVKPTMGTIDAGVEDDKNSIIINVAKNFIIADLTKKKIWGIF